jgi:hypothetical protein
MYNILVIYWDNMPKMRITTHDHLYCFNRYLDHNVYYVNLEDQTLPALVHNIEFDIIIFHDLFFCGRWGGPPLFNKLRAKIDFLRHHSAVKIAVPQDEFISADLLCEFINDFNVRAVFSVTPESEWPKVYRDIDRDKVKLYCVLTGYLDDATLGRISDLAKEAPVDRPIDIGYRAGGRNWRQASWLGRHGILKIEIAERFNAAARRHGVKADISTRSEDTFIGEDWYRFLLRQKYTVGLEGGASILDWDGTIRIKTLNYVEQHPEASLIEIEQECFPGLDGSLALFALSPRHLEACATRSCQILIEGAFNGVLEPWRHYIPLKRDFGNLDEILEIVKRDELRSKIVENAYQDIVASGGYTYREFARYVIAETEATAPELRDRSRRPKKLSTTWNDLRDLEEVDKNAVHTAPAGGLAASARATARRWLESLKSETRK